MRNQRRLCELKWELFQILRNLPVEETSEDDYDLYNVLIHDGEVLSMMLETDNKETDAEKTN